VPYSLLILIFLAFALLRFCSLEREREREKVSEFRERILFCFSVIFIGFSYIIFVGTEEEVLDKWP